MLTLQQASIIIDAAIAKARSLQIKPLAVAALDSRGVMIAFKGEDGIGLMLPDIARAKAYGCIAVNRGSRQLMAMAIERPHLSTALTEISGGRFVPVPGGVLIRDANRTLLGAIGISGDTSDNDEICAVAGIEAAGMIADTGG